MTTQNPQPIHVETLDREVVARAQAGDEQAFAELVHVFEPAIRRVAVSLLSRDRVDDAVQDILLKIHRQLHRFDLNRADRLRSWLMVVARNLCLDELRRPQRPNVPLDELDFDLEADSRTPLQDVLHEEMAQQVMEHLETLPEWYRDAFCQRCLEGDSYEEIADRANITRAAARTRVGRARQQLRVFLEETALVA